MAGLGAGRSILGLWVSSAAMLTVFVVTLLVWSSNRLAALAILIVGMSLGAVSALHFGRSVTRVLGFTDGGTRVASKSSGTPSDRERNRQSGSRWLIGLGTFIVAYNIFFLATLVVTDEFSATRVFAVVFGGVLGTVLIVSGKALRHRMPA